METLTRICINKIVNDIDDYMLVFNGGNEDFKRPFEFLQRAFSEKLITALLEKKTLKPEHVTFLLNPHLKKLNLRSSVFNDAELVISRLKEIGPTVTSFLGSQRTWSENDMRGMLSYLPNVEEIDLSETSCSDEVLPTIQAKCNFVRALNLSYCSRVTDSGIKQLYTKKQRSLLKVLHLHESNVTENGLIYALNNFPLLESLDHPCVACVLHTIHKHSKKKIKRFAKQKKLFSMPAYHLKSLKIDISTSNKNWNSSVLEVVINACSVLCPEVTKITVEGVSTSKAIEACADFCNLKSASFIAVKIQDYNLLKFLNLKGTSLEKLKVSNMRISPTVVSHCCPNLQTLVISESDFMNSSDGCQNAYHFPHLKKLKLEQMSLYDPWVANYCCSIIRSSPCLETISFIMSVPIFYEIIDCIVESKCIRTIIVLNFACTDVNAQDVERLVLAATNLEVLNVTDCDFTSEELTSLKNLLRQGNRTVTLIYDDDDDHNRAYSDDEDFFMNLYDFDFLEYDDASDPSYYDEFDDENDLLYEDYH